MKKTKAKAKTKTKEFQEVVYAPPAIEITDITLEQNVLDSGSGNLGGFGGEPW
ncbi:MAG: hypothetical protein WC171_08010 [Bacteroidales bacterium]